MADLQERLIGAWSLVDWTVTFEDGRPAVQPLGEGATGRIHYAPDGIMNATIMGVGRLGRLARTVEDRARLYASYMHYGGRWRVEGDVVHHAVDFALDPSLIGRSLARAVRFDGDDLILTGDDISPRTGKAIHHQLRWRRDHAANM